MLLPFYIVIGLAGLLLIWDVVGDRNKRHNSRVSGAHMKRLQEIADVPMEDIIAAAEWRAEHPHEPIPQVLADLDPETRQRPAGDSPETPDIAIPVVSAAPPPPPAQVRPGPVGVWLSPNPLAVSGFMERFTAKAGASQLAVISSEMTYQPINRPGRYDNCDHPDADHARLMSHASADPVRTLVTGCEECDLAADKAEFTELSAAINAAGHAMSWDDGVPSVNQAQYDHYHRLIKQAERLRQRISEAVDRQTALGYAKEDLESLCRKGTP